MEGRGSRCDPSRVWCASKASRTYRGDPPRDGPRYLAPLLIPGQPSTDVRRSFGKVSREERKSATRATAEAVAATRKLGEIEPDELPDILEAIDGLAIELRGSGRRREARILTSDTRYLGLLDGEEERPLNRMSELALRLGALDRQQEALAATRICRDLAP